MKWSHVRAVLTAVPLVICNLVAFTGQLSFIRDHLRWPLAGDIGFAAGLESIAIFLAFMAHDALMAEDSAFRLRLGAYGAALVAASLNYSHYSPHLRPTFAAVGTALMSAASPWLWGTFSRRASRDALMAKGLIEPHAVRLAPTRWTWHPLRSARVMYRATWAGIADPREAVTLWQPRGVAQPAGRPDGPPRQRTCMRPSAHFTPTRSRLARRCPSSGSRPRSRPTGTRSARRCRRWTGTPRSRRPPGRRHELPRRHRADRVSGLLPERHHGLAGSAVAGDRLSCGQGPVPTSSRKERTIMTIYCQQRGCPGNHPLSWEEPRPHEAVTVMHFPDGEACPTCSSRHRPAASICGRAGFPGPCRFAAGACGSEAGRAARRPDGPQRGRPWRPAATADEGGDSRALYAAAAPADPQHHPDAASGITLTIVGVPVFIRGGEELAGANSMDDTTTGVLLVLGGLLLLVLPVLIGAGRFLRNERRELLRKMTPEERRLYYAAETAAMFAGAAAFHEARSTASSGATPGSLRGTGSQGSGSS